MFETKTNLYRYTTIKLSDKAPAFTLIFAITCFLAILFLRLQLVFFDHPDISGMETNVVYSMQRALAGYDLYSSPMEAPFAITQYTPLYYQLCIFTARVFSLNPSEHIYEIYVIGRLWNVIFNILLGIGVFLICRNVLKVKSGFAFIAGICSFNFLYFLDYAVRPDSMQDMLLLWSVYFFLVYLKNRTVQTSYKFLVTAVSISTLSIFVKQSSLQLPLIFLAFLFFVAEWKGFLIALFTSALIFTVLLLFYKQLYGKAFFENVIGGVSNGISLNGFITLAKGPSFILFVLIPVLLVAYIAIKTGFVFKGDIIERFFIFCCFSAFAFASLTALKTGSSTQYYVFFTTISLIFVLWYFTKKGETFPDGSYSTVFVCTGILLLLGVKLFSQIHKANGEHFDKERVQARKQDMHNIAAFIKKDDANNNSYVFANISAFERNSINNILFDQCLVPQLEILEQNPSPLRVFGYNNFETLIRKGMVKYIIETIPPFHYSITQSLPNLKRKYIPVKTIGSYCIYKYSQ